MLMTAEAYRDSLRQLKPRVFINGERVESVADEPLLAPGVNAMGVTYDFAHDDRYRHLMTATEQSSGKLVNRMLHVDRSANPQCGARNERALSRKFQIHHHLRRQFMSFLGRPPSRPRPSQLFAGPWQQSSG